MLTKTHSICCPEEDSSSDGKHNQPPPEIMSEIALDSLNVADCILIKTANSAYHFVITDPERRRGLLMGGALGARLATGVLLGAEAINIGDEVVSREPASGFLSKLSRGTRAVFFVVPPGDGRYLITSVITGLAYTSASSGE